MVGGRGKGSSRGLFSGGHDREASGTWAAGMIQPSSLVQGAGNYSGRQVQGPPGPHPPLVLGFNLGLMYPTVLCRGPHPPALPQKQTAPSHSLFPTPICSLLSAQTSVLHLLFTALPSPSLLPGNAVCSTLLIPVRGWCPLLSTVPHLQHPGAPSSSAAGSVPRH